MATHVAEVALKRFHSVDVAVYQASPFIVAPTQYAR
jgi:hypothetical protein